MKPQTATAAWPQTGPRKFFFRAVASDGKIRTGSFTGSSEKVITGELRKQGLTPIYVGVAPQAASFEIKLPSFRGNRRRDVLFFTQELSTLLTSSVPLDRALSITAELTERPYFRVIVLDVLRVLKGGRSVSSAVMERARSSGTLEVSRVESSWVKKRTSRRRLPPKEGSLISKEAA